MRLARLEGHAHGLAWPQQVVLPHDLVNGARSQALGQGRTQSRCRRCGRMSTCSASATRGVWQIEGEAVLHGPIVAAATQRANV